jgi:hypothetical protein
MKLCKDCRWIRPQEKGQPLCGHPTSVSPADTNPVTGEAIPTHPYTCTDMRFFLAWGGFCGSEGLHWEATAAAPVGFA